MGTVARDPIDRLADKFLVGDDCWLWTAALDNHGYGQFFVRELGRMDKAHRILYELLVGPIPEGLTIDHLCRNRACVRPSHMEPVTRGENVRRGDAGANMRAKTHCPQGHPYDEANTKRIASRPTARYCRACSNRKRPKR